MLPITHRALGKRALSDSDGPMGAQDLADVKIAAETLVHPRSRLLFKVRRIL